jgi:hypothetical protein
MQTEDTVTSDFHIDGRDRILPTQNLTVNPPFLSPEGIPDKAYRGLRMVSFGGLP